MSIDRDRAALEIFEAALALEQAERDAYLHAKCIGDAGLLGEVKSLLHLHDEADELLPSDDAQPPMGTEALVDTPFGGRKSLNAIGQRIDDFLIEAQIGAGGMGVVFRAQQISLNRQVALKVLPPHLRFSSRAQARFRREVEAAARLHHTNIVGVYTSGEADDTLYYAMELIEGPPLNLVIDHLRADPVDELRSASGSGGRDQESSLNTSLVDATAGPGNSDASAQTNIDSGSDHRNEPGDTSVPHRWADMIVDSFRDNYFDAVAAQLADVADGLDYAHRHDVIHRDVKPSNLLFSRDGRLHLGDFGLARILEQPGVTQTGEYVGTPFYMAPEQVGTGQDRVSACTDIYALGATLYELLTLQPPFPGESRAQVIAKIGRDEPSPPRDLNPRVPRDLETICLKALQIRAADRYPSAAEMAADLRRYVDRYTISARRIGLLGRTAKLARRHPGLTASLVGVVALANIASAFAWSAYDLHRKHATIAQQRDNATAQANQYEQDLSNAESTIKQARQTEQERVFEQALLACMQGDQPAVESALVEAERLGASPGRLHLLRGQIALFSASFQLAIQEFEAAIELMPNSLAAHSLMAEAYARCENWGLSARYLASARAIEPTSIEDLILKGRMEAYHDSDRAENTLDLAAQIDRGNVVVRLIRGNVRAQRAYDNCDPAYAEQALEDLRLASTLLPETAYILSSFMKVHLTAAAGYETAGDTEKAQQHLDQAGMVADSLERYAGEYDAHRWRAFYFERQGNLDQAIIEWQAIDAKTIGFLAMNLYRVGRFDEAIQACHIYQADSDSGTPDFCRSFTVAATCGSAEKLAADFNFERLLVMDSNTARRSIHILWSLAGQPERASEEIRKTKSVEDSSWRTRLRYGYLSGELSESDYLNQAARSRYELARAHLSIGVRHLSLGHRANARHHFEQAIQLRLDFDFLTAVSQALLSQLDRDPAWPHWIREQTKLY